MKRSPNKTRLDVKEIRAIQLSVLFLIIGCLVLWIVKSVLGIEGDIAFTTLLFAPLVAYAIISDKIQEFKGPGGLEAKFAKTASESVNIASEEVKPSIDEMSVVRKESLGLLEQKKREIDESKPMVMILEVGKGDYYDVYALREYIEALSQFPNFKFVVFVDNNQKFLAYMPSWALKGLLNQIELGESFIYTINQGNRSNLFRYPGVLRDTIDTHSTNADALREMMRQNLEALVVTNESNQLVGVVEREQVLSRMMLSLIK